MLEECRRISTLACLVDLGFYLMFASHLVCSDLYCKTLMTDILEKRSKFIYLRTFDDFSASPSQIFDMKYPCFFKIRKRKIKNDFLRYKH